MKLTKTVAISAGVCAVALTAISNQVFAADTATSTKNTTAVSTTQDQVKEATIVSKPGLGVLVWNAPNGQGTNKYLANQSKIKFIQIKNVNGHAWYELADNGGWVDGSYVKEDPATKTPQTTTTGTQTEAQKSTTAKNDNQKAASTKENYSGVIEITNDKGAAVYSDTVSTAKTSRTLPAKSNWKAFFIIHRGGLSWYNLGGNQYVLVSDISPVTSKNDATKKSETTKTENNDTKKPTTDTSSTASFKVSGTTTITNHNGATVYSDPSTAKSTNRKLAYGTNWKTFSAIHINGYLWYNLGGNQYVQATDVEFNGQKANSTSETKPTTPSTTQTTDTTGTLKINYKPGYGIRVWGQPGKQALAKTLKTGSNWKFFKTAQVNGKTWYNLGGNQWIDGQYALVSGQTSKKVNSDGKVVSVYFSFGEVNYKPGYGIAIWSAPNGHVTGDHMKTGALLNINDMTQDGKWLKVLNPVTGQAGWVQASYINPVRIDS